MKKNELIKVLKPLIKQTIREVLLEEGMLSSVVSEVVKGMGTHNIVEAAAPSSRDILSQERVSQKEDELERQRQERIRRLNETTSFGGKVNVFEGTQAIPAESSQKGGALAGVPAGDPGVDISAIVNIASGKWKDLI